MKRLTIIINAALWLVGLSLHGQIVPATTGLPNNSLITSINSGVTLSPSSISTFATFNVGPIDGTTYNATNRYSNASNSGGTTPWITVSFSFNTSGLTSGNYYLSFLVTNKSDNQYSTGLAIDAVSGVLTQGFETGSSALPSGWSLQGGGTHGIVSSTVTGLAPPSGGGSQFAFIDTGISGSTTGTISTSAIGGTHGIILTSPSFSLTTGSTLSMQLAFVSNDGTSSFEDFALAQLFIVGEVPLTNVPAATLFSAVAPTAIPEPATTTLFQALSCMVAVWYWIRLRSKRERAAANCG